MKHHRTTARSALLFLLPVMMLAACADSPCEPVPIDRNAILEAVYRYTYTDYVHEWSDFEFATFAQADTWVFRVDIEEELRGIVPPLLQRLEDLPLPVRPFEECEVHMRVKHPDFSGRGIALWVGSMTVTSRTTVVVYAGYFGSEMGAAGQLIELRWERCGWQVVRADPLWVS